MRTLRLRDAKAWFSAVVEAAERGESTIITKHGRAAAVVVPVVDAQRLLKNRRPSFVSLLRTMPRGLEIDRDPSPVREAEL